MSADPTRAKSIFLNAAERPAGTARDAYLAEACGADAGLRLEVDDLLAHHGQVDSFLEGPNATPTTDSLPPGEAAGAVLAGRYKLLEPVGEGGMGMVWMAQQTDPVKRLVAVKLIKPGMDSKQVLARFEAERQALALMDHPNIAKVHDAGATSDGHPFFVMELVKGIPITKYCDDHHLTPRERLELFVPVCQAIQHAHQKGVIHRDIKPSNVLVARYDDRPVPKVIDFGVAKATGQALTEQTLHTGFGAVVGTVEYMSPEQATFNQLDVDTRSDIYSLGVLLYELLTGSPPFTKKELEKAGVVEMLRVIREQEPSKPSAKLSTAEGLPTLAANRGTEPARLTKLVRGELDWIVMKALEKDRSRRYETANGFATDVQRHLADEPVQAGPPSTWYRFRKFTRRKKGALATAGAILFFVLLLAAGFGWVLRDRKARLATRGGQVEQALRETEQLYRHDKLPEAILAAEKAEGLAASGVEEDLLHHVRQWLADLAMVAELEESRFRSEESEPDIAARYLRIFRKNGMEIESLAPADAAAWIAARPVKLDLVAALDIWAMHIEPGVSPQRLLEIAKAADPDPFRNELRDIVLRKDVARLRQLGASADAADLPLATSRMYAVALKRAGDLRGAIAHLRKVQRLHPADFQTNLALAHYLAQMEAPPWDEIISFRRAALAARPRSAAAHRDLGIALARKGAEEEALFEYRTALRLNPDDAGAHYFLGHFLKEKGELDEAIAEYRATIRLSPTFAAAHKTLARALENKGLLDDALPAHRRAISLNSKDPDNHASLGIHLCDYRRDYDGAIECFKQAIRLKHDEARYHNNLAVALFKKGDFDTAIPAFREAVHLKPDYAEAHHGLGFALWKKGLLADAVNAYREAIRLECDVAIYHQNLAVALGKKGDFDEAIAAFREALRLKPDDATSRSGLALSLNYLSRRLVSGPQEKAHDPHRAVKLATEAVALAPATGAYWNTLGLASYRHGRWQDAIDALEKSIKLRKGGDSLDWFVLAMAQWQIGKQDVARTWYDRGVQWMEKNQPRNEELRRLYAEAEELLEIKKPGSKVGMRTPN